MSSSRQSARIQCLESSRTVFLLGVVLVVLLLQGNSIVNASDGRSRDAKWERVETRPASGEQCLVCGQLIDEGEIVQLRYRGRQFHVSLEMLDRFEADPELYFSRMEARSALFDESALHAPQPSMAWLFFGVYVSLGLVFGAGCGYMAMHRRRPPLTWFLAGFFANVIALVILLSSSTGPERAPIAGVPAGLRKIPSTYLPETCGSCGASNHPAAQICSRCGAVRAASVEPESSRV